MGVLVREKVKGSGEWWIFINHNNKRKSRKVGDKRSANAVKKVIESKIAQGTWDTGESSKLPTLAVQGQKFIDSPLREWSERTHRETQILFNNHVSPALGKEPIDKIEIRDVKKLLETVRGKGLSSSSAKAVLRVLRGILEDAREDGLIPANPCLGMGKYCGNGKVREINPLDAQGVSELLKNAQALPLEIRTLILVAVRSGLRIGELLALEWSDVDFEGRTVEVSKSFDYHNLKVKSTKTGTSRTVRITPQVVEGLKDLKIAANCGKLLFCDEDGGHLTHQRVSRWLRVISPISLHDLRHTYATLRIAKSDNIVDVSKQMGHASIETTLRSYTHWMPSETYVAQVDELDNLHLSAPYPHPGKSDYREFH